MISSSATLSQLVSLSSSPEDGSQDSGDEEWGPGLGGGERLSSRASTPFPRERLMQVLNGKQRLSALGCNFGLRHSEFTFFRPRKKVRCYLFSDFVRVFKRGIKRIYPMSMKP